MCSPRFPLLDGLRAVAALSVVVFHANQYASAQPSLVGGFAAHLDAGVAIFFVITGFLIYRPMLASARGGPPALPVAEYFWRRLLRIVPAFWLALLVLAPLLDFASPAALPNFGFAQIYSSSNVYSGIPPAWSICVEVSFYALLPLAVRFLHVRSPPSDARLLLALVAASAGSMVFRGWIRESGHAFSWYLTLPSTFPWFALGMALAVVSTSGSSSVIEARRWVGGHPVPFASVALVMFLAFGLSDNQAGFLADGTFLAYGVIAILLVAPAVFAEQRAARSRLLGRRDVAWLGLISYGIYLYHHALLGLIDEHLHVQRATFNLIIYSVTGIAAAVACGAASYYLIERRALQLKHRQGLAQHDRAAARVWLLDGGRTNRDGREP